MLLSDLIQPRATGWRGPEVAIPVLPKANNRWTYRYGAQPKQMACIAEFNHRGAVGRIQHRADRGAKAGNHGEAAGCGRAAAADVCR